MPISYHSEWLIALGLDGHVYNNIPGCHTGQILRALRAEGRRIYALGAPLKGSTLLNYCNIGPDLVELATEVNRFKIGRFTPGTHLPIVYEESLTRQPDYYLVLSWNFLDYFVEKYAAFLRAGGKFIVPHPVVRVVGAEALEKKAV